MSDPATWLYIIGTIATLIGSYLVARLGAKANTAKIVADKEAAAGQLALNREIAASQSHDSAGQLALNIANRLDAEVLDLRRWRNRVTRWWPEHDEWDDRVLQELHRLDPDGASRVGLPPRLPPDPFEQDTQP